MLRISHDLQHAKNAAKKSARFFFPMSTKNYKETLNLPKTDFPMKADLVKREPERLEKWERENVYAQILDARKNAPEFVLHDGPPFANGDVHMGTALNKILKDIIVKSRSMLGFRAPFVPGWDCHGLPIEFKVVKESRGLSPLAVRKRSEDYARKYIDIQRAQFRRLGVFGDWQNPYLTMNPTYEAEIIRAFASFVEQGLVYQSRKPVYWSTGAQTALAEAEVEYAEREDPAIFVKFPIVSGPLANRRASMIIWTTTPWTLPANVAVAVHPQHRYVVENFRHRETGECATFVIAAALVLPFVEATKWDVEADASTTSFTGKELAGTQTQHPFLERKSRVIVADFVTLESGTGQVHIAPGHGADDYVAGVENGLPILSPVDEHGKFTEEVGVPIWSGKYVFDANKDVIEHLRASGALLGEAIYKHSYPHCWRSKTPVVFRAVEQFFIRIDELRGRALEAIEKVNWIPAWGRNRISATVESRPDWCISRQRSWGVPLPVFYDEKNHAILDAALVRKVADLFENEGTNLWFERDDAWWISTLGLPAGTTRRNDTLDVWIDSGVSHEAVLNKRLHVEKADVYIEATDQHRGWFQSSLMIGVALKNEAPYKTCITHGFVVDVDTRKKISKSAQGTYAKPMDAEHFVSKHGADIVRLWVSSVNFTDEVPFSEEMFTRLADTYRRIRNTLRILLANIGDFRCGRDDVDAEHFTLVDHWIMDRLQNVIATCRDAYEKYEFHRVYHAINQFCAVDLSSLYIDITKDRLYCDALDSMRRRATQTAMCKIFDAMTILLAPVLAFTADEAWEFSGKSASVHLEKLPEPDESWICPNVEKLVDTLLQMRALISQTIEDARKQKLVGNSLEAAITLELADHELVDDLRGLNPMLEEFFIISKITMRKAAETKVTVAKTPHGKCPRCWRHRPFVITENPDCELCDRCSEVVGCDE